MHKLKIANKYAIKQRPEAHAMPMSICSLDFEIGPPKLESRTCQGTDDIVTAPKIRTRREALDRMCLK